MFNYIVITAWLLCFVFYICIRIIFSRCYEEEHYEIFGRYLSDHSVRRSLNYVKFVFLQSKWPGDARFSLRMLLQANRLAMLLLFMTVFGGMLFFVVAGTQQAMNR